jgi:hypothetical protein
VPRHRFRQYHYRYAAATNPTRSATRSAQPVCRNCHRQWIRHSAPYGVSDGFLKRDLSPCRGRSAWRIKEERHR